MTDKVQKIRNKLERLKEETSIGLSEHENGVEQGRMEIINALSLFLDSMQEEPVSKVWHDASEKPEKEKLCLVLSNIDAIGGNKHLAYFVDNKETGKCGFLFGGYIGMDMVVKWAYVDDLINL